MSINDNDDTLNLILQISNNYYCIGVCKKWYTIIFQNSIICKECNKIVKMYNKNLWISDADDSVCHGFYDDSDLYYYSATYLYTALKGILSDDYTFMKKLKRQTIGLCLWAIKINADAINYIKNKDNEFYMKALKVNADCLQYILDPTYDMCLEAVKHNSTALKFVPEKYKDEKLCLAAVTHNLDAFVYV